MQDHIRRRLRHCLVAAAATLTLGCAGARTLRPQHQVAQCESLHAPTNTKLAVHAFATGVQIYRWSGTSWSFVGPEAVLSSDSSGRHRIGTHYAGPTWASDSGSKVVGTVAERCTPNPAAIPWLSLGAVAAEGPGIFHGVTFIQRMRTVGGVAPSSAGSSAGEEARVPYMAEYFFYRAE